MPPETTKSHDYDTKRSIFTSPAFLPLFLPTNDLSSKVVSKASRHLLLHFYTRCGSRVPNRAANAPLMGKPLTIKLI